MKRMTEPVLGTGYFSKQRKTRKRCATCRWFLPETDERGACRVMAPLAATAVERGAWAPTEPANVCEKWSRLRVVNGKPKDSDIAGQTKMWGL